MFQHQKLRVTATCPVLELALRIADFLQSVDSISLRRALGMTLSEDCSCRCQACQSLRCRHPTLLHASNTCQLAEQKQGTVLYSTFKGEFKPYHKSGLSRRGEKVTEQNSMLTNMSEIVAWNKGWSHDWSLKRVDWVLVRNVHLPRNVPAGAFDLFL